MVAETALATWMKWTVISLKAIQQTLDLLVSSILQISAVKWWALLWRQSLFASSFLPSLY